SKPLRLAAMNSAHGAWNQVAHMKPSSCQHAAKRCQSPESLKMAQLSTSSCNVFLSSCACMPAAPEVSRCADYTWYLHSDTAFIRVRHPARQELHCKPLPPRPAACTAWRKVVRFAADFSTDRST